MALLIANYLLIHQSSLPLETELLEEMCPGSIEAVEEGVQESPKFSETGLMNCIKLAVFFFRKAQSYEFAIQSIKFLVPLYEHAHQYSQLAKAYEDIKELYQLIIENVNSATFFLCF
jgi:hypothetical protein